MLGSIKPTTAAWVLAPFLESYAVVAELLTEMPASFDEKAFMSKALGLGQQYQAQGKITAAESVSQVFFKTALDLAKNRDLAGPTAESANEETLAKNRQAFVQEIDGLLARIRAVSARPRA